ncbi:MAG: hypothetical protein ACKONH_09965, partial [Planctomycetia bacterium]
RVPARTARRVADGEPQPLFGGVAALLTAAVGRPPGPDAAARLVAVARACGAARGVAADALPRSAAVWQDVGHAIFTLPEFIHVE